MAAPQNTVPEEDRSETSDEGASFRTFEPSSQPEPSPQPPGPPGEGGDDERPTLLLTVLAVVGAVALGAAIALLSASAADLSTTEVLVTGTLTAVVAFAGLVAIRWGWYVAAGVTLAFFGLVIYNLALNQDSSVFGGSDPQDLAYAVLGPGPGVVLGYLLQGLYSFIAGE